MLYYTVNVNPQPWAVGDLDIGRKNGKVYPRIGPNHQLVAFQEAVREELSDLDVVLIDGPVQLKFWFWRHVDKMAHQADGTNLCKAAEDALQGILITNDRNVVKCGYVIVEQSAAVDYPGFIVGVEAETVPPCSKLKKKIYQMREVMRKPVRLRRDRLAWGDDEQSVF